ncbi:MAG: hypothetical protein HC925_04045 [Coleofasciculaceae cyanobacterium SM2_3_26]|nr:hypothetical protein [Coleofasciculaceae cyanobacterium SM2_3_26]
MGQKQSRVAARSRCPTRLVPLARRHLNPFTPEGDAIAQAAAGSIGT